MPIDLQSGDLTVRTRDQVRDRFKRDYIFRVPDADVSENSQPHVDATLIANVVAPFYSNANVLAKATTWLTAKGKELSYWADQLERPRKEATGGIGYVIVEAASGGGTILADAELRHQAKGIRYKVLVGGVYQDGDLLPIQGIDTGSTTNIEAGAKLNWVSPPPGILGTCRVFENSDGSGVTGGGAEETDEELLAALIDLHANPPASGNDAAIRQFVLGLTGIAIQQCFVFPCIEGPGEYAVAFTMRPDTPGASRLPNGAQIAKVEADLLAAFPADDGIFVASVSNHDVKPCVKVRWVDSVDGFVDATPWPPYNATKYTVRSAPAPTATTARFQECTIPPSVGNTVAFYDTVSKSFKRKRIATVTEITPNELYDVTFDVTGSVSDPSYVPLVDAIISPFATNMSALVAPMLAYMDKQGVGEMVASFGDPGRRQRRSPQSKPGSYPHTVTGAIIDDVYELVDDATMVEPTTPYATTTGTAPLLVYLHRLADVGVFSL